MKKTFERLNEILKLKLISNEKLIQLNLSSNERLEIYPLSVNKLGKACFFIGKNGIKKHLYIVFPKDKKALSERFQGNIITFDENDVMIKQCKMDHGNASLIRELFEFTRPSLIGVKNSFGFGDRLGIAGPGHIRSLKNSDIKPVLAQQSVRELERTGRQPEDVIDAATWAVFQEGYKGGFGADADHLKTIEDIDLMVKAGFTMFTIDPGEFVVNEASMILENQLFEKAGLLPWNELKDTYKNFLSRYKDKRFVISGDYIIEPSGEDVMRALVKYGNVIVHTVRMYGHLKKNYPDYPCEIELSVDETESPTTPFEHFLIVNELSRLGIKLVGLAPRFIGNFEKGIDYKGDIDKFREEYIKHVRIAEYLGPYKISLHSGSDKFRIYGIIKETGRPFHVKTAGTSYLEALRTVAAEEPELFKEILTFSLENFESEKKTYRVSAYIDSVPSPEGLHRISIAKLLDHDHTRQVLHVTYGKVLSCKDYNGEYLFRKRILNCLKKNETLHYKNLQDHLGKHIKVLENY